MPFLLARALLPTLDSCLPRDPTATRYPVCDTHTWSTSTKQPPRVHLRPTKDTHQSASEILRNSPPNSGLGAFLELAFPKGFGARPSNKHINQPTSSLICHHRLRPPYQSHNTAYTGEQIGAHTSLLSPAATCSHPATVYLLASNYMVT